MSCVHERLALLSCNLVMGGLEWYIWNESARHGVWLAMGYTRTCCMKDETSRRPLRSTLAFILETFQLPAHVLTATCTQAAYALDACPRGPVCDATLAPILPVDLIPSLCGKVGALSVTSSVLAGKQRVKLE